MLIRPPAHQFVFFLLHQGCYCLLGHRPVLPAKDVFESFLAWGAAASRQIGGALGPCQHDYVPSIITRPVGLLRVSFRLYPSQ